MNFLKSSVDLVAGAFSWVTDFVAAYPVPATLVALLGVVSGAWANHKNRRATIFGHSMQAITHLDSRWESHELRQSKRLAASFLHRYHTVKSSKAVGLSLDEDFALTAVLNFLEVVGAFVKSGAVGQRMAWQLFGSAAQCYVEAASVHLTQYRKNHESIFSELQYLYLISRVEEQRLDLPLAWLWRRVTAVSLTSRSHRKPRYEWLLLSAAICHAAAFGRIPRNRRLPNLFTNAELLAILTRDMQGGKTI
jgi:hypothetical protein